MGVESFGIFGCDIELLKSEDVSPSHDNLFVASESAPHRFFSNAQKKLDNLQVIAASGVAIAKAILELAKPI